MALPTFKSQDEIPEPFRAEYEERDGEWKPKAEVLDAGKKAIDDARRKADAATAKANEEKRLREAAEKERDDLRRVRDADDKGIKREELDRIAADLEKKYQPIVERLAATEKKLQFKTLNEGLKQKLLDAGVMPDRIKKAMNDLIPTGRVTLTDDGEDFVVHDENGHVTATPIDEFLTKDYKQEASLFYAGTGTSGSGGTGSTGGGGGGGYDPVAEGKKAAAAQKQNAEQNKIAFT